MKIGCFKSFSKHLEIATVPGDTRDVLRFWVVSFLVDL